MMQIRAMRRVGVMPASICQAAADVKALASKGAMIGPAWVGEGAAVDQSEASGAKTAAGRKPRPQAVTILGAPIEVGAGVAGCAMGPAMLRTAGVVRTLKELGHDV